VHLYEGESSSASCAAHGILARRERAGCPSSASATASLPGPCRLKRPPDRFIARERVNLRRSGIRSTSRSRSPAPREEVFDYLVDIANHAEFTDHYLTGLASDAEGSVGRGAGAPVRVKAPLQRFSWMGVSLIEVDAPWRIVEAGRGGKYNRIRR